MSSVAENTELAEMFYAVTGERDLYRDAYLKLRSCMERELDIFMPLSVRSYIDVALKEADELLGKV